MIHICSIYMTALKNPAKHYKLRKHYKHYKLKFFFEMPLLYLLLNCVFSDTEDSIGILRLEECHHYKDLVQGQLETFFMVFRVTFFLLTLPSILLYTRNALFPFHNKVCFFHCSVSSKKNIKSWRIIWECWKECVMNSFLAKEKKRLRAICKFLDL